MIPTTEIAKRISSLFARRLSTAWSEKEVRRFKILVKEGILSLDDLELIERYYAFQRRRGDSGIHRRDLYTFLNNFSGELDRARAWEHTASLKLRSAARYKSTNGARPCDDNEFQRISDLAKAEYERFKRTMSHLL